MDQDPKTDPTPEKPEEGKTDFMKSSEAKMVLYVVPVALILVVIAYIASSCGAA
jgi:hypothetical protein